MTFRDGTASEHDGRIHTRRLLSLLLAIMAVAAMLAAPMAAHADPADDAGDTSGQDSSSTGNANANDLGLYHAASSVSGWYKKATNINNNADAIHGPGVFKSTDGSKQPAEDCPVDGSTQDGAKADDKCRLDQWWSLSLSTPSSAGSFLGFYDAKYSGVGLGTSNSSASSEDVSYKSLATQSQGGYPGVADYAYFGAALHTMGLDESGYGASDDKGRTISGIVILVLFVLASAMGAIFQFVLKLLGYINPFTYINNALENAAHPDSAGGNTANGFVQGLEQALANFTNIGIYVMLPLFIITTIVLIVLIANRSDAHTGEQRGRIKRLTRNTAMRWLFIVVLVPLMCETGYATMHSVNVSSNLTTGTTSLVQSLYVDYGDWAQYNAMGVPQGALIGYSADNAAAEPLAVYYELNTAKLINNAISKPYSPGSRDNQSDSRMRSDTQSLTMASMPYPKTTANGCNASSMATMGGARVTIGATGLVGDLNDRGVSTDALATGQGNPCTREDQVNVSAMYESTLGLITEYVKGGKITAGDYDSYIQGAIQQSMGKAGERQPGTYTPASPFIALNAAGDSNTAMNTPKALNMCGVKSSGSGGTPVECVGSGGKTDAGKDTADVPRAYVPPQYNGLIQTGSVENGKVNNKAGLRAVGFDDVKASAPGDYGGPINAIVDSLTNCGGNGREVRGSAVSDYAFCTANQAGKHSAQGVGGQVSPIYCSIKPLTETGGDTLTACNMSPLSLYNYLNSQFDEKKVTVYSASNTTGTANTPYHYSVTRVGSGFDGFLNTLYIGSLLGCMALIGIGLIGSLLINGLRKSGQTILALAGSMFGSLSQMGKAIIAGLSLMVVLVTTMGVYMLTSTAFTYAPALMPVFMRMVANSASGQLFDYFANNAGMMAMVFKGVTSALLIIFAFWVLRLSDAIVKGLSEGIESLTVKLFGMQQSTRSMQKATASVDAAGLVTKGAMAAGMATGAGVALAHTGAGEKIGDMLADKLKDMGTAVHGSSDTNDPNTLRHLGSGDDLERMHDQAKDLDTVAPATDAPGDATVMADDPRHQVQDADYERQQARPDSQNLASGYQSPADAVHASDEARQSGDPIAVMGSADADAARQLAASDGIQSRVEQADEATMKGQGQAVPTVYTPTSENLGTGTDASLGQASDATSDTAADMDQDHAEMVSRANALADVQTPESAGLATSSDSTTTSTDTPVNQHDATVGDHRVVSPQDQLNVTDASDMMREASDAPASAGLGAGQDMAADGTMASDDATAAPDMDADAQTPQSAHLAADDGTVTVSSDSLQPQADDAADGMQSGSAPAGLAAAAETVPDAMAANLQAGDAGVAQAAGGMPVQAEPAAMGSGAITQDGAAPMTTRTGMPPTAVPMAPVSAPAGAAFPTPVAPAAAAPASMDAPMPMGSMAPAASVPTASAASAASAAPAAPAAPAASAPMVVSQPAVIATSPASAVQGPGIMPVTPVASSAPVTLNPNVPSMQEPVAPAAAATPAPTSHGPGLGAAGTGEEADA